MVVSEAVSVMADVEVVESIGKAEMRPVRRAREVRRRMVE